MTKGGGCGQFRRWVVAERRRHHSVGPVMLTVRYGREMGEREQLVIWQSSKSRQYSPQQGVDAVLIRKEREMPEIGRAHV